MTDRLTPEQRRQWKARPVAADLDACYSERPIITEPAIGTVGEVLGILARRMPRHGRSGRVRLRRDEKCEYVAWLRSEGLPVPDRYL